MDNQKTLSQLPDVKNLENLKDFLISEVEIINELVRRRYTVSYPLSMSLRDISIPAASATSDGYLTLTDWIRFNAAVGGGITSLTGEATGTGPGATAVTLSNAAVIAKVLTGYVATSGSITATDTILSAIEKLGYDKHASSVVSGVASFRLLGRKTIGTGLMEQLTTIDLRSYIKYIIEGDYPSFTGLKLTGVVSWTERQPAGNADHNWDCGDSDSDGSNLIAGEYGGRLWTSSDNGANWTERRPDGTNADKNWFCCASDGDGSVLIAGQNTGRLYVSTDSGANWTEVQPLGNNDEVWWDVAASSDGTHLIAISSGTSPNTGRVFISTNSGSTWTEIQPAGNVDKGWGSCAISGDNSTIIVGDNGSGYVYTSTNDGSTWTTHTVLGTGVWATCGASSDGQVLAIGNYGGRLMVSRDGGSNWVDSLASGDNNKDWNACGVSGDGKYICAGVESGRLYISKDSGANWTEAQPSGNANKKWFAVGISTDGYKIFVVQDVGRTYTSNNNAFNGLLKATNGDVSTTPDCQNSHIEINPCNYNSITQGTWGWDATGGGGPGKFYQNIWDNSTTNDSDQIDYKVGLNAGTYSFRIIVSKDSDAGIYDLLLDGVSLGTYNGYALSYTKGQVWNITGYSATAGLHTLSLKVSGTTGTDYALHVELISMWRTA